MSTLMKVRAFRFDELSDDAKKKVAGHEQIGEWIWEDLERDLLDDAEYHGVSGDMQLLYSFGFCQGDGVGFKGFMEAIDNPDPDWQPILAMLGAYKQHHVLGGIEVSWPTPIISMTVEISNPRDLPFFNERSMLQLRVVWKGQGEDGEYDDAPDDLIVGMDDPLYAAVASYYDRLSHMLYRRYSDELLSPEADRVEALIEGLDWLFDAEGNRIDDVLDLEDDDE